MAEMESAKTLESSDDFDHGVAGLLHCFAVARVPNRVVERDRKQVRIGRSGIEECELEEMDAFEYELGELNEVVSEDMNREVDCSNLSNFVVVLKRSHDGVRLQALSSEDEDLERSLRLSYELFESIRFDLVFHVRFVR